MYQPYSYRAFFGTGGDGDRVGREGGGGEDLEALPLNSVLF